MQYLVRVIHYGVQEDNRVVPTIERARTVAQRMLNEWPGVVDIIEMTSPHHSGDRVSRTYWPSKVVA